MNQNGVAVRTWEVPTNLSWEDWASRMREVSILHKKLSWYVGDLINYGIEHFGEKAWQLIDGIRLSYHTIQNYKSVAGKIPQEERNAEVPFTVYQDIAALPRPERDRIVSGYLGGTMNRADIRALKSQTNGNGGSNGLDARDATATQMAGIPSSKEQAKIEFSTAMLICVKLMKYADEENLLEALDDLIAKAMSLRELL